MSLSRFIPFAFLAGAVSNVGTSVFAGSLHAQSSSVTIEGGVIGVQQEARGRAAAGLIQLAGRHARQSVALSGAALLVGTADSAAAAQATLGAELALPWNRRFRVELSGTGTVFGAFSTQYGHSRSGLVRPHFATPNFGAFSTFSTGLVSREGSNFRAHAWDAGAWAQRGALAGSLLLRRSYTDDYPLVEASNFFLTRDAPHYVMQDVQLTVNARMGRVDASASAVRRVGIGATTGSANGALVSLSAGVTPRLALILTGGAQLAEVVSGVPAARVGGISLRYQLAGARTNTPTQSTGPVERARSPFDTRVEPLPTGGAVVTVRVNAPADATVELMGTHNEWAIVPLVRVNDAFEMRIQLPRGSHRLAVRINGGEWRAPQGLARARDDMGGEVGIVIVP